MTRSLRLRHATHLSAACLLLTCGLPLARATDGISSKDSTASTVTTAAESQPLWSGPALPATAEAPELTDVWCSVIKPYAESVIAAIRNIAYALHFYARSIPRVGNSSLIKCDYCKAI